MDWFLGSWWCLLRVLNVDGGGELASLKEEEEEEVLTTTAGLGEGSLGSLIVRIFAI
jgi:hypothetical protein